MLEPLGDSTLAFIKGPQATVLCTKACVEVGTQGCCLELERWGWDSGSLPRTGWASEQLQAVGGEAAVS